MIRVVSIRSLYFLAIDNSADNCGKSYEDSAYHNDCGFVSVSYLVIEIVLLVEEIHS